MASVFLIASALPFYFVASLDSKLMVLFISESVAMCVFAWVFYRVLSRIADSNHVSRERDAFELKTAREAKEAATIAKTQFVANVSHEIRTPLGVIIGFTELGLEPFQTDKERLNSLQVIQRNARQLAVLVDELLDLSKIESNKIQIEITQFPLKDLISDIASVMSVKAREKSLRFTIESQGKIPVRIQSDPKRVRQILMNLIGNALKFTHAGGVRVIVRSLMETEELKEGVQSQICKLQFEVSDTGIGMNPEQQRELFKPFSQADPSMARRFGGTGLGLALSKKFAQALGGDLVLSHSELGVGSSFTVTVSNELIFGDEFKLIHPQEVTQNSMLQFDDIAAENVKALKQVLPNETLKGVRVLLVEDSADNRAMVTRFLKKAGAQIETAENGSEGVVKALEDLPDVIVMDLQMPIKDGYTAARDLRSCGFSRPIVALTAHAMRDDRQKTLASGFDEYLTKPVNRGDLIDAIRRLQPEAVDISTSVMAALKTDA